MFDLKCQRRLKKDEINIHECAGGLIQLSRGQAQNLQYVVNAVFLASVYADYLDASDLPGWKCGSAFIPLDKLREFATSQVQNSNFIVSMFSFRLICQTY